MVWVRGIIREATDLGWQEEQRQGMEEEAAWYVCTMQLVLVTLRLKKKKKARDETER